MKPYYYILNPNRKDAPRVKHSTLKSAQTEAGRLSLAHPGESFEILMSAQTFFLDGIYGPTDESIGCW